MKTLLKILTIMQKPQQRGCRLPTADCLLLLLLLPTADCLLPTSSIAATFTVTSIADVGLGTLRAAIDSANANVGADIIDFNIVGPAPHTIILVDTLPGLTDTLVIDGTTQPPNGFTGVSPKIIIDGDSLIGNGLTIRAPNCEIYGLYIHSFSGPVVSEQGSGIWVVAGNNYIIGAPGKGNVISGNDRFGIAIFNGFNGIIQGNKIGTDTTGTVNEGNGLTGIQISSPNTLIGGSAIGEGNLISGNLVGIRITGFNNTTIIRGNKIGTDITGTVALGNTTDGIRIAFLGRAIVGGSNIGEGNLISGNGDTGIEIWSSPGGPTIVQGNYIGTDITGTAALGNNYGVSIFNGGSSEIVIIGGDKTVGSGPFGEGNLIGGNISHGIYVSWFGTIIQGNKIGTDSAGTAGVGNGGDGINISVGVDNDQIGGIGTGQGNIIAFNTGNGVNIDNVNSEFNPIRRNLIFNNGDKAINLNIGVTDGNDAKSAPTIAGVNSVNNTAWGTAEPNDTIEVFKGSAPCSQNAIEFLGQTTADGSGNWILIVLSGVVAGDSLLATATDTFNNTSEFSVCMDAAPCDTIPPVANAVPDTSICAGDSVQLNASGGTDYSWNPPTGLSDPAIANPVAAPTTTTTYTVTVSDTCGFDTASVTIIVTSPVVNIGNDTSICGGDSIVLDAGNPGATYNWSTGDTTQTITVDTAGTYWVEVNDSNCIGMDTIIIIDSALIVVLGADMTICSGDSIVLDAGNPGATYNWSTGDTTQIITIDTAGTYWVEVNDSNCIGVDTIIIIDSALIVALGADTSFCEGDSIGLDAGNPGSTYLWSTGDTTQTIIVDTAGTYWVTVGDSGCIGSDTIVIGVDTALSVNLGADQSICLGASVILDAGFPGASWQWSTGANTQIITVNTNGTYWVAVTNGACIGMDTVNINLDDCTENTFYIPNGFSPNDDGENDVLFVRGTGIKNIKLLIYNRWGEKVFETYDIKKGWDGTYKGKKLNTAVFAWYAEVEFEDGNKIYRKGNVSLIR